MANNSSNFDNMNLNESKTDDNSTDIMERGLNVFPRAEPNVQIASSTATILIGSLINKMNKNEIKEILNTLNDEKKEILLEMINSTRYSKNEQIKKELQKNYKTGLDLRWHMVLKTILDYIKNHKYIITTFTENEIELINYENEYEYVIFYKNRTHVGTIPNDLLSLLITNLKREYAYIQHRGFNVDYLYYSENDHYAYMQHRGFNVDYLYYSENDHTIKHTLKELIITKAVLIKEDNLEFSIDIIDLIFCIKDDEIYDDDIYNIYINKFTREIKDLCSLKKTDDNDECCVCFDNTKFKTMCNHTICINCFHRTNKCPLCRKDYKSSTIIY